MHTFRNNQNFRICFANCKIIIPHCSKYLGIYYIFSLSFKFINSITLNIPTINHFMIFLNLIIIILICNIRSIYFKMICKWILKRIKFIIKKTIWINQLISSLANVVRLISIKNNFKVPVIFTFDSQNILSRFVLNIIYF